MFGPLVNPERFADHDLIDNHLLYGYLTPTWDVVVCPHEEDIPPGSIAMILLARIGEPTLTFVDLEWDE